VGKAGKQVVACGSSININCVVTYVEKRVAWHAQRLRRWSKRGGRGGGGAPRVRGKRQWPWAAVWVDISGV